MTPASPRSWLKTTLRWLLPAAVFVFGFGRVSDVAASSFDADEHARHCGCGNVCKGESCCCGPKKPKVKMESQLPAFVPDGELSNPCLNNAPCQVPGLPPTSSVSPFSKAITLAFYRNSPRNSSQWRFVLPWPCVLPDRRAARLDDPPESPSFG